MPVLQKSTIDAVVVGDKAIAQRCIQKSAGFENVD
jgi:hypothetical protein